MAIFNKEDLLNPLWQKKRLEILERDYFQCQHCGNVEKTLNVHHLYYDLAGKPNPCDYTNSQLITLCKDCHREEHDLWKLGHSYLYDIYNPKNDYDGLTYGLIARIGITIFIAQYLNISDHSLLEYIRLKSPPYSYDKVNKDEWVEVMIIDYYSVIDFELYKSEQYA